MEIKDYIKILRSKPKVEMNCQEGTCYHGDGVVCGFPVMIPIEELNNLSHVCMTGFRRVIKHEY